MPAYRILPPVVIALNLKRLYCADKPSTVILLSCRNVCRSAVLQCGLLQGPRAECFSGSSADLQDTQAVIIPTTSPKWSFLPCCFGQKKKTLWTIILTNILLKRRLNPCTSLPKKLKTWKNDYLKSLVHVWHKASGTERYCMVYRWKKESWSPFCRKK